jgi:hypothetical protein
MPEEQMRVTWTKDVSLENLRKLSTELGSDFEIEIDEMPRSYKSAVPPSWVRFYAENNWWIKGLGAYAAIYVAEIVREAAKDTWKNRSKIVSAAVVAGGRVRQLAVALASLRKRLAPETGIEIALPFPDDYEGTILQLIGTDVDELAVECAVFVHYLPALMNLIRKEALSRGSVATGIQLVMLDDLSLEVSWLDGSLKKQTQVLTLE